MQAQTETTDIQTHSQSSSCGSRMVIILHGCHGLIFTTYRPQPKLPWKLSTFPCLCGLRSVKLSRVDLRKGVYSLFQEEANSLHMGFCSENQIPASQGKRSLKTLKRWYLPAEFSLLCQKSLLYFSLWQNVSNISLSSICRMCLRPLIGQNTLISVISPLDLPDHFGFAVDQHHCTADRATGLRFQWGTGRSYRGIIRLENPLP